VLSFLAIGDDGHGRGENVKQFAMGDIDEPDEAGNDMKIPEEVRIDLNIPEE